MVEAIDRMLFVPEIAEIVQKHKTWSEFKNTLYTKYLAERNQ